MSEEIEITVEGEKRRVPAGTAYRELAREAQEEGAPQIVLVTVNGKLQELHKKVTGPSELQFVTTAQAPGMRAYKRSLQLLMNKAVYDVTPREKVGRVVSRFSVTRGIYVEVGENFPVTEEWLKKVRARMWEMVEADLPFQKKTIHVDRAREIFRREGMEEKEKLLRYRRSSYVNTYSLEDFVDYHYGYMVPSTGYLKYFDLLPYHEGFVLRLPARKDPNRVAEFVPNEKLFAVMQESTAWGESLNLSTVGDLNDMIAAGRTEEMILAAEARQEKQIADIAAEIARRPEKKIVLIAGPSSSGKTSFSHRLAIQLIAQGMRPHPLAVDDYFVERDRTPRDENGSYDFESLACVDIEQFKDDMNRLLNGETVKMPHFNFIEGRREYPGNTLSIGPKDILIIEGIHCLNEKMSDFLPEESKFRIYISALTQLSIDEHNRIPSSDGRLIRRLIRDARTRGFGAAATLAQWPSVRAGEEKNIFPYQESADVMFNSSLVYEFSVLKPYAEQLLFGIPEDDPQFQEAKRLLKFFDYFLAVDSRNIPKNSLLKEFIGGSIFHV